MFFNDNLKTMKKILTILFIGIFGFTLSTFGVAAKKARVNVINQGPCTLNVKVQRDEVSISTGSVNYFCWDQCFNPSTSESGIIAIGPGDTVSVFYGYYDVLTSTGTSVISYCFFDDDNPSDSVCVTVSLSKNSPADSVYATISLGGNCIVGIDNYSSSKENNIVDIYPNPAQDLININYSLVKGVSNGKLVVTNMLGKMVRSYEVRGSTGKAILETSELENGIYFYSLVVNGKTYATRKLLVSH